MRKVTSGVMVAILLLLVLSVGVNAQAVATNFAMGQGDTLMLIGNGVVWYELSRSNN